ncbi:MULTISPECIES: heavy-metal-associated domain-containing protein [unclassified Thermosipho (in: thermotogales)]|uniref:heavy-metal-associated domain-containing protein n=1 Tax=unclassified Thermosipho (in: thermotogales) TaxID=2676525 RepID=UPI0009875B7A|nr:MULTISPECIES: heavy-metal-associated domain-containing protein [unclassified Thermosipho (in: thermotogales)]MBT1247692.1 copper resistance protein CopZ [Thermosipho sp. 1244]OOC46729.1 copper resistance protein CopZ [Thermosipho sp. 1223]
MRKYILNVPNMSCEHCVMRISKALEEISEENFKINLEEKIVEIETNNLEKVKEKLSEIDYPISEVKEL